jgi:hypothetical protein
MKNFVKNLYSDLKEELVVYADLGTLPVRKLTGALSSINEAVTKLKNFITITPFETVGEEIHFFKYDKPAFICEQFYAMEIFTIETARPLNDADLLKIFYEQELKYIKRFLEQNKFLYAYFQFDMKELDHVLFIRDAKPVDIPVPDTIGLDPLFTTCCDQLWGKFMAFERLQIYLLEEIRSLENPKNQQIEPKQNFIELKWTGEAINLMEIAIGVWLTGQVNDGNASLTEITRWLEIALRVKIGRPNKRWNEISSRTRNSPTKFLGRMQDAIRLRIDEELDISRNKRQARRNNK